jgi:branched-chain amino acid transport system permease protein
VSDAWLSVLTSGIVLGSLYALMASGLSLVWTTLGIFNFAHGALMTVAAYLAYQIALAIGPDVWIGYSCLIAVVLMGGVGALVELALIRPFYGREDMVLVTVMTTLAGLTLFENGVLTAWGPRLKQIGPLIPGTLSFGAFHLSWHETVIVLLAPVVLVGLFLYLNHTLAGRAIRAVGQNKKAAELMGIPVTRMAVLTFALAAALAGLAGVLLASIRFMTPTMGADPLVKSLMVVIFGGLGSIGGSIGAAYVIGLLEAVLIYEVGLYWAPSALFLLMILMLLFRPEGLFGRIERSSL